MGTFLKVVGIAFFCLGIVAIIFSLVGMSTQKSSPSYSLPPPGEEFYPFPEEEFFSSTSDFFSKLAGIGGILGGFGVLVGGAALFCLGSIYNDVRSLKNR
ncbi:MAG TPA: hypothetical protein PK016_04350 [Candidatus Atribacteria bacterium]|nr:hypothetical protein [Candidatus Atribacteria bacterium]